MAKKKNKKKAKRKQSKISQPNKSQSDINYPKLREKTKSMLNQLGFAIERTTFIEPSDGVKMSEVILKLSEPLLKKFGDSDKRIETIISLTITVWNKLMFLENEQNELQDEMIDRLTPRNGNAEDIGVITYIHDLIAERKSKFFPSLKKAIMSYDLKVSGGVITLNVSSIPIKEKYRRTDYRSCRALKYRCLKATDRNLKKAL